MAHDACNQPYATSRMEYTAVWIWLRLTLATCILELVYSQLLALRTFTSPGPWPLVCKKIKKKIDAVVGWSKGRLRTCHMPQGGDELPRTQAVTAPTALRSSAWWVAFGFALWVPNRPRKGTDPDGEPS